ncbi:YaiO family outer membrane beta-barrel protein [Thalassobellus sediminis]|uniref:YaiO family outer membrane beta-barrel protein n=1 Tax=Thalassobellus sediminis TaxID=3367753 RepID=UPI0037A0E0FE
MKKHISIILMLISFCFYGQQKVYNGNPDTSFKLARELAFNNNRKQAQDTLLSILTKYPNYNDIRSFLGSTYSWDGNYKKAKEAFSYVLKNDPKRLDTWEAAIKNELYSEAPFNALKLANTGLEHFPESPELLYLKASAEEASNKPEEALQTIEKLLENNPKNEKALSYKTTLSNTLRHNIVGIRNSLELYSDVFDPMQYYFFKYVRQTKYGSLHAKVNFSRRFASNGVQFEVDAYPRIAEGIYAYLNFGVSNSFLFPDIRYGAEIYKSLPKSFEASLGFRSLKYSETTNIYTGSLGWYTGNNYWSFRSYVTPGDSGSSMSGTLTFRRYRSNADNFFSIEAGIGFSPEIYLFEFEGNENTIVNLDSQKVNLGYFFTSKNNKNAWGIRTGIVHQEISFDPGTYFWIFDVGLSWELKFR